MTVAQKSILFVFLAVFGFLLVVAILATGIFRKEIRTFTLDESKQLAALHEFLREEGLSPDLDREAGVLRHPSGWILALDQKRGLPWVVYPRTPDRSRITRSTRYTTLEIPLNERVEGFLGERRFSIRQNYLAYFEETFGWTSSSTEDDLIWVRPQGAERREGGAFLADMRQIFERSPTENPVILIAHDGRLKLHFPFWPGTQEQFDFIAWVIRNPVQQRLFPSSY